LLGANIDRAEGADAIATKKALNGYRLACVLELDFACAILDFGGEGVGRAPFGIEFYTSHIETEIKNIAWVYFISLTHNSRDAISRPKVGDGKLSILVRGKAKKKSGSGGPHDSNTPI
jgi:hypothetical protein